MDCGDEVISMKLYLLIIICFLSNAAVAQPLEKKLGHNENVGRYADIRGFKMYYEVYGTGQPLLFIHGNGGSMSSFSNQLSYFSMKFKVILADSRAQGKSVDEGDTLSYEMMADDFSALLDQLKLDSCFVVGWSDGGINALLLAMRHPEKVKKMAITGANLWPDTTALDPWIYQDMLTGYNNVKASPPTAKSKNDAKLLRLMLYQPHIKQTQLKEITCPTLVIGGDHDVILPQHTLIIAASIPKSNLWILPNAGHSTPITYKDEFNKTVMDFFIRPYKKIKGADTLK
jgi:pimeloyl-ACP methyl ester carboxylesterase